MNLRTCAEKTEKTMLPFWVKESSVVCIWLEGRKVSHLTLPNKAQTASCRNHSAHLLADDCIVNAVWLRVTVWCWWLPYNPGIRRQIQVSFEQWRRGELDCKGLSPVTCGHTDGWGFVEAQIGELLAHQGDSYSNAVLGFRQYSPLLGHSQPPTQAGYSCSGRGP